MLQEKLDELQLIRYSLLPGELINFLDESEYWTELLEVYATEAAIPDHAPQAPTRFQIKVETAQIWFEVSMPQRYPADLPEFSVKGENISRSEQERWQNIISEKMNEISGTEYPVYQLVSLHLLPILHAEHECETHSNNDSPPAEKAVPTQYHALLTSHHLISPNKRRSLQQWSASLSITGFAKVGYPGVIYAQGIQESVEEFVANIKSMQWLALKVRFVEPIPEGPTEEYERRWCEFQKVGDVVEEMRRIGRERFIVEMGIGSAGMK